MSLSNPKEEILLHYLELRKNITSRLRKNIEALEDIEKKITDLLKEDNVDSRERSKEI